MSKPYLDKESGKWKWGTRGEPKYNTKEECSRDSLEILTERLRILRRKIEQGYLDHGK